MTDFFSDFLEKVDEHNSNPVLPEIKKQFIDNNLVFVKTLTYLYFDKGLAYILDFDFKNPVKSIIELKSRASVFSIEQVKRIIEFYETITEDNLKEKLLKLGRPEDLVSKCCANTLRIEAFARTFREMAVEYLFERESYEIIK